MVQEHGNDTRQEQLLRPILEILGTAMEGAVELLRRLDSGYLDGAQTLLDDIKQVASAVASDQSSVSEAVQHGSAAEQLENIMDTLEEMWDSLAEEKLPHARYLAEYQLLPFLHLLRESFYFWGGIYPDPARMARYYVEEFADHYRSPYCVQGAESRYRLSIVVAAYNHLETTRRCVEHILRYADLEALDAELVLIDHGSSDGTLEFFRAIPNAKVIHFKRNVRMYMFAAVPLVSEGAYINFVSNDVLVTRHWVENLMACLDSDPSIAAAVPMTPNIANLQMLQIPTQDPEQFVQWADQFNRSDPALWSDRARLMPNTCMYRASVLAQLGLADPYLYSMEFWDDDFSLRARRAGFRQILCEDTACYHFGSVTSQEAKETESTLEYGRTLFQEKNGVDAWGNGFCYDYGAVRLLTQCAGQREEVSLLGLDCGFGDTPLQMRNELRHLHRAFRLYQVTIQPEYAPDLRPFSDEFLLESGSASDAVRTAFPGQTFDLIYLERSLAYYPDWRELLRQAYARLTAGGFLLLKVENPWYALNLNAMLQLRLPDGIQAAWLTPGAVQKELEGIFSCVQVLPMEQKVAGTKEFIRQHYGPAGDTQGTLIRQLSIKSYYMICGR